MKTILIIDDDEYCRTPAAILLRRDGWNVLEAADGERGMELALEHRPDVILCDLMMPRGNGFHVCRTVRANPEMAQTKLVVMSGSDYEADRQGAKEAGADAYLLKPIEFAELRAVVRRPELAGAVAAEPVKRAEMAAEPAAAGPVERGTKVKFWGVAGRSRRRGRPRFSLAAIRRAWSCGWTGS